MSQLWGRIISLIGCAVGIPILTYLMAGTTEEGDQRAGLITMGLFLAAALVLVFGVSIVVGIVRLRATRYTVTNQRLLVESGVFSKNVDEIDMRLIDDSLFKQGFIDRLLGIGDVTVMSSDKNTPVFTLRGVRDPRAVRELIRTHAYHASQRQVFTRPT
ncbi:MAG TPA: PH domain-containing protein [Thermoanaerobaculia bacterium]|nr:PH domain-containing protein [Thermoanaerobaculia bacterium]